MQEIDPNLTDQYDEEMRKAGLLTEREMQDEDARIRKGKGLSQVKGLASDNSGAEKKMNLEVDLAKLGPLYDLFGDLPLASQESIIKDIQQRHDKREDSRAIIAHALELISQHKKFTGLQQASDLEGDQQESDARKVVEEMLRRLREVSEKKPHTSSQIELPFENGSKQSKPTTWVN